MTDSALVYGDCQAKAGSPSTVERLKKTASTIGLAGACVALCVAAAHAGTDTTFDSIATQITDWTDGSLGRVRGRNRPRGQLRSQRYQRDDDRHFLRKVWMTGPDI